MRRRAATLALLLTLPGCASSGAAHERTAVSRLVVGSDLWFRSIFTLTTPAEGGALRFLNDHLSFVQSSVRFSIPLRRAVIAFSRTANPEAASHLPLTFTEAGFAESLSWDAPSGLAGGITLTREERLSVIVGSGPTRAGAP
ncbi:MAG TPA: hypothetical protein VGP61_09230 [Gemmatimonadales bacterium]|jgi:hypothetical protein|nr:hypothetical protein [Gemmatimonadales bacterium]